MRYLKVCMMIIYAECYISVSVSITLINFKVTEVSKRSNYRLCLLNMHSFNSCSDLFCLFHILFFKRTWTNHVLKKERKK